MGQVNLLEIKNKWKPLASFLSVPHSETDYNKLVVFLDRLVDEVRDNEHHPLVDLMETVGTLIEAYEEEHFPFSEGDPLEALRYLMKEFNLTQKDLPELGSQGVVSEILSGKRELNVRQIKALSNRFHLSPATFF